MASVYEYPNFAVLCSFFERYSQELQLPDLTIPELKIALEHKLIVVPELREILFKLLRKIVKSINREKWERKLVQLTREHFDKMAAWEIEQFGFVRCRLETKIEVLKFLCESQFDDNTRFKNSISNVDPDKLRVLPIGRDKTGLVYWYQKDQDTNVRVYREEQDDVDSSTWEMVSAQRDELASLINTLKEGFTPSKAGNTPDDSESTSDSIGAIEKAVKAQTEGKGDSKEVTVDNEEKSESKDVNKDKDESSSKTSANGDDKDSSAKEKEGENKMELSNTDKNGNKDGEFSRVEDETKSGIKKLGTKDEDRDVRMVGKKGKSENSDQGENYKGSENVDDLMINKVDDNKATKSTDKERKEQLQKLSNESQSKETQQKKEEQHNQNLSETSTKPNKGAAGFSLTNDRREGKDLDDVKASTNTKLAQDNDKSDNPNSSGVKEKMEANSQDKDINSQDDQTTTITKGDEETKEKEGCKEERKIGISSDDCGSRVESVIKYTGEKKMIEEREGMNEDADIAEDKKIDKTEAGKSVGKEKTEDIAAEEDGPEDEKIGCDEKKANDAMENDGKDAERSCGQDTKIKGGKPEFEDVTTDDAKGKDVKDVTHKESKDLKDAKRAETELAKDKKNSKDLMDAKRAETELAKDKKSKDLEDTKSTETELAKDKKESKDLKDAKRTETELAKDMEIKDLKDVKRTETKLAKDKKDHCTTGATQCSDEAVKKVSKINDNKDSCKINAQIKSEIKKEEIISGDEVVKNIEVVSNSKENEDSCKTNAQIKTKIKKEETISVDEVVKKVEVVSNSKDDKDSCRTNKSEIKSENKSQTKSIDVLDDSKKRKQQNGIKKEEIKDIDKDVIEEHIEKCTEEAEDYKKSSVAKLVEGKDEDVTENNKKDVESEQKLEKQKKRKLNEVESDSSELSQKKIKGKDTSIVKKGNSCSEKENGADSEEESDKKSSKKGKTKSIEGTRVMPPRRSTRSRKPVKAANEDSEENSDDKDKRQKEEEKSKKGKAKAKAGCLRKQLESGEDEEDNSEENSKTKMMKGRSGKNLKSEEESVEKNKSKDKKGSSKKRFQSAEDEEDSVEEKSKSKAKKRQSRKGDASDEESASEEGSEDSEEDEESEEQEDKESTKKSKGQAKKGGKTRYTSRRKASANAILKIEVCEEEEEEEENDQPCSKCQQFNHPEWILLCDKCDSGYHTACLRPPLMIIPDGNWYCPTCEHAELIVKLEEALTIIDAELHKKRQKQSRKNKSTKWAYTDLCMENILPDEHIMVLKRPQGRSKHKHRHKHHPRSDSPFQSHSKSRSSPRSSRPQRSSRSLRSRHQDDDDFIDDGERHRDYEDFEIVSKRSTRQRKQISYKFEDFDEAINSAIHEEIEEHQKSVELTKNTFGINRGKDMSNILGAEAEEEEEDAAAKDKAARKIRRKLTDLDGTTSEEDSDDFKVEESDADITEEEPSSDSDASGDSGVVRPRKRSKRTIKWSHLPKRKSERTRSGRRRKRYEYESEEEESSGAMEELGSDESSAYSDYSGSRARKHSPRRPNYREKSDSETESEVDSTEECNDYQELMKKPKKDYETSSDEEDDAAEEEKAYSMKRKFVLESDEDEEEEVAEKKETRTIVKKSKEKKRRKRDEVGDEMSLSHDMKPTRSKRVDYKKMALGDGESVSETEEQEYGDEDKSASKQNHKSKDASSVDSKESISEKSNKAKLVDSDRTLKGGASDPVNGSDTIFNGDDDDEEEDISAAPSEVAEGDVEDEDLLNIADLVDFVTQDS